MFEAHLREVVSKAARSQGVVHRAEKLFDCLRVLKSCVNAHALSSLAYCRRMVSVEYHLSLLDCIIRSAERLCEGELCCLGHRRWVSALYLL